MKDITDLTVTQIRVFSADMIPFRQLITKTPIKKIKELFKFSDLPLELQAASISPDSINFIFGEIYEEGKKITIETVIIDPRRIVIRVLGTSEQADLVYSQLKSLISEYDQSKRFEKSEPIVKTEETTCVVFLDIDFYNCFSNTLKGFLENKLFEFVSSKQADGSIRAFRLGIEIGYKNNDESITKHGISLSNKNIVIEVRAGTSLDERRFYTSSPTNSDIHFKLLQEFESAIKSK